jgi:FdhE protein
LTPSRTTDTGLLWQLALARWAEIDRAWPDLSPALAVQKAMLRLLIDAAERLEDASLELPEVAPDRVLAKWARGLPALRNEVIPIPSNLKEMLPALCEALALGGAGDSAVHIKEALADGRVDAGSLLSISLARNHKALRMSSIHLGFSPDLMWLIGELAVSPLAHYYQARLRNTPALMNGARAWNRGYCPCCGSWPAFVELLNQGGEEAGDRSSGGNLRCSFCASAWELTSARCIYCDNADDRFLAAAPDMARPNRRLELCGACGSYTKVIEVGALTPFPLMAIEDLASMDLDEGAMSRDYRRPPLVDLDALDPPASSSCS